MKKKFVAKQMMVFFSVTKMSVVKMDFKGRKIDIFGIQGSGKTHFARRFIQNFKKPIVYGVHPEDFERPDVKCYLYKPKGDVVAEFPTFFKNALSGAKRGRFDAIFIDEADMFFRENYELDKDMNDAVLNHRHYDLSLVFISRRPQDLPTRIVESSHYLIIFKQEGANAMKKFDDIDVRIRPLVEQLSFERHDFVIKELGKPPVIHAPLT